MKRNYLSSICAAVLMALMFAAAAGAQTSKAPLPAVIAASVPLYPIGPHTVNIQGIVRIRITTDGHSVTMASIEDDGGNPALGRAAQENAKTWQFANHSPVTFTVTYRYILLAKLEDIESNVPNSKVILRFPTSVEVYAQRWPKTVDVPPDAKK